MPFVSKQQRKYMYANHPIIAARFEEHTPKGTKLPEHVKKNTKGSKVNTKSSKQRKK